MDVAALETEQKELYLTYLYQYIMPALSPEAVIALVLGILQILIALLTWWDTQRRGTQGRGTHESIPPTVVKVLYMVGYPTWRSQRRRYP